MKIITDRTSFLSQVASNFSFNPLKTGAGLDHPIGVVNGSDIQVTGGIVVTGKYMVNPGGLIGGWQRPAHSLLSFAFSAPVIAVGFDLLQCYHPLEVILESAAGIGNTLEQLDAKSGIFFGVYHEPGFTRIAFGATGSYPWKVKPGTVLGQTL